MNNQNNNFEINGIQYIKDGPIIPYDVIAAQESGNLIFFCGAGVSANSGLPMFSGLVDQVLEKLQVDLKDDSTKIPIIKLLKDAEKKFQYDRLFGYLEHEIAPKKVIREIVQNILTFKSNSNQNRDSNNITDLSFHKAILKLARHNNNSIKLVTTNFDNLFYECIKSENQENDIQIDAAPKLPIPNEKWSSIVHLHGRIDEILDQEGNNLVLTSKDMGKAYLTEGWARRFLIELLKNQNYVIAFIGYSLNDPILTYLVDALAVEKQNKKNCQAYIFTIQPDNVDDAKADKLLWETLNLEPIYYNQFILKNATNESNSKPNKHKLLIDSIIDWSLKKDFDFKINMIKQCGKKTPKQFEKSEQSQFLWYFYSESDTVGKIWSEIKPPPSFCWLSEVFDNNISKDWITQLRLESGLSNLKNKNNPFSERGSYLYYDKYENSLNQLPTRLVSKTPINYNLQLDPITFFIIFWLGNILDPENYKINPLNELTESEQQNYVSNNKMFLDWVIAKGGHLHPQLCGQIEPKLDKIKNINFKNAWEIILYCSRQPYEVPNPGKIYLLNELAKSNKPESNMIEFSKDISLVYGVKLDSLQEFNQNQSQSSSNVNESDEINEADYKLQPVFSLVKSNTLSYFYNEYFKDNTTLESDNLSGESYKEKLNKLLVIGDIFIDYLKKIMKFLTLFDKATFDDDYTKIYIANLLLPPKRITAHIEWAGFAYFELEYFKALLNNDLTKAQNKIYEWNQLDYPIFKRLILASLTFVSEEFLAENLELVYNLLTQNYNQLLWSHICESECLKFLEKAGKSFASEQLSNLIETTLLGPQFTYVMVKKFEQNSQFLQNLFHQENLFGSSNINETLDLLKKEQTYRRLQAIKKSGVKLNDKANSEFDKLTQEMPPQSSVLNPQEILTFIPKVEDFEEFKKLEASKIMDLINSNINSQSAGFNIPDKSNELASKILYLPKALKELASNDFIKALEVLELLYLHLKDCLNPDPNTIDDYSQFCAAIFIGLNLDENNCSFLINQILGLFEKIDHELNFKILKIINRSYAGFLDEIAKNITKTDFDNFIKLWEILWKVSIEENVTADGVKDQNTINITEPERNPVDLALNSEAFELTKIIYFLLDKFNNSNEQKQFNLHALNFIAESQNQNAIFAKTLFASRLPEFYNFYKDWTEANLIPKMDWERSNQALSLWCGFLWRNNITPSLAYELKDYLLDTIEKLSKMKNTTDKMWIYDYYNSACSLFIYIYLFLKDVYDKNDSQQLNNIINNHLNGILKGLNEVVSSYTSEEQTARKIWNDDIKNFISKIPVSNPNLTRGISFELIHLSCQLHVVFDEVINAICKFIVPFSKNIDSAEDTKTARRNRDWTNLAYISEIFFRLNQYQVAKNHPEATLKLLDKLFPDDFNPDSQIKFQLHHSFSEIYDLLKTTLGHNTNNPQFNKIKNIAIKVGCD